MAIRTAPTLTPSHRLVIGALPTPALRRAATVGLWPALAGILAEIARRPSALRTVPAAWVAPTLACLPVPEALAAAAADPRAATRAALAELHLAALVPPAADGASAATAEEPPPVAVLPEDAELAALDPHALTGLLTRNPALADELLARTATLPDLARERLLTTLITRALELPRGVPGAHEAYEALAAPAIAAFQTMAWGDGLTLTPRRQNVVDHWAAAGAPPEWLDGAPPLNLHAAALLLGSPLRARELGPIVDRLGCAPELRAALAAGGLAVLWHQWRPTTGAWIIAERALDEAALAHLDLTGHQLDVDATLTLLELTTSPTLTARLTEELHAGRCGTLEYPNGLAPLTARLGREAVAPLLRHAALATWLAHADDAERATWAAATTAEVATGALQYADPHAPRHATLLTTIADHVPGLPTWMCRDLYGIVLAPLRGAVVTRLAEGLGEDPVAWQAAWALCAEFPGSTSQLVTTVRALQV